MKIYKLIFSIYIFFVYTSNVNCAKKVTTETHPETTSKVISKIATEKPIESKSKLEENKKTEQEKKEQTLFEKARKEEEKKKEQKKKISLKDKLSYLVNKYGKEAAIVIAILIAGGYYLSTRKKGSSNIPQIPPTEKIEPSMEQRDELISQLAGRYENEPEAIIDLLNNFPQHYTSTDTRLSAEKYIEILGAALKINRPEADVEKLENTARAAMNLPVQPPKLTQTTTQPAQGKGKGKEIEQGPSTHVETLQEKEEKDRILRFNLQNKAVQFLLDNPDEVTKVKNSIGSGGPLPIQIGDVAFRPSEAEYIYEKYSAESREIAKEEEATQKEAAEEAARKRLLAEKFRRGKQPQIN